MSRPPRSEAARGRRVGEVALPRVVQQPHAAVLTQQQEIGVAVAVEIPESHILTSTLSPLSRLSSPPVPLSLRQRGDDVSGHVLERPVQYVAIGAVSLRRRKEEIEIAVVIEIEKQRRRRSRGASQSGLRGGVGERRIAHIAEQDSATGRRDEQVEPSVVVVVPERRGDRPVATRQHDAGGGGDIRGAAQLVAKQVPTDEDILAAVAVVVSDGECL